MDDAENVERLRASCTRWLAWHGHRTPAEQLAALPEDVEPDRYGAGGVVTDLEAEVAELLGHEAAAFFISGTMAQQIALRIHADRLGARTVAFHPTCHLDLHEQRAFERLHGLVGRPIGGPHELFALSDLGDIGEPLAAVLWELPQREIGRLLPTWDELVAQVGWARERGVAAHLDGARLWQCSVAYDRPLDEIAGLFDSVYVSFYKDLGGLAGSMLVGSAELMAEAREWRSRHGGTLFAMWPYAASSLAGLRERLPRMKAYREHAVAIADALRDVDGVRVVPDPPHASMFHLHLRTDEDGLESAMRRIAEEDGVWTWPASTATAHPDWRMVELTVGDATLGFTPSEVRDLVGRLLT